MAVTRIRNGIDIDRLVHTIDAIKSDEGITSFTFKANTQWKQGSKSAAEISSFTHAGQTQEHEKTHLLDTSPVKDGPPKNAEHLGDAFCRKALHVHEPSGIRYISGSDSSTTLTSPLPSCWRKS